MDQSVRLEGGDQEAVQRLIQYFLRCPFSQARTIKVTATGQVIYKTEVIEKIPRHCGLCDEPSARAPPSAADAVEG